MPPKSVKWAMRIVFTQRRGLAATTTFEQLLSIMSVSIIRKARWRAVTNIQHYPHCSDF